MSVRVGPCPRGGGSCVAAFFQSPDVNKKFLIFARLMEGFALRLLHNL